MSFGTILLIIFMYIFGLFSGVVIMALLQIIKGGDKE